MFVVVKSFEVLLKKISNFVTVCILILIFAIALSPARFIESASNGLLAFATKVLPCTLPFMILTKLVIEQGNLQRFCKIFAKPFKKFYGTSESASYVFFMSVLSGYPVGSKMVADLYESGKISRTESFRMCSFCSNSGPMFIVGTVGAVLFGSIKIGFILFFSHLLSALLNGLIYRKLKAPESTSFEIKAQNKEPIQFGEIVSSSVSASLNVGAIICLFFIIIDALLPLFSLLPASLVPLAEGLVELTRGCIDASSLPTFVGATICSFVISFGGFSTIMQSNAMLKKLKMPVWLFSVQKLSQGIISAAITTLLLLF